MLLGLGMHGVFGSMASLSTVDPRFEVAINVAAGAHLNDIITDGESTAIECINYLKANNLGRVRFLPLDRLQSVPMSAKSEIASKMSGIVDFAINLISYDRKYDIAFRNILRDTSSPKTQIPRKKSAA